MSDLFGLMDKGETFDVSSSPLADRLRPTSFEEVFGQDHMFAGGYGVEIG